MVNYANTSNVTGMASAIDYTAVAINQAAGYDAFGILLLGIFCLGFYVVGSRYTQERALTFTTFMGTITAFLMVSAHILDPFWLMIMSIGLLYTIFFMNRVG